MNFMSFFIQHKARFLLFLGIVLVGIGVFYKSTHEARAIVPVHCPTICETWDVGISGRRGGISFGIPFLDDLLNNVLGTKEGWVVKKEADSLSSAITDPLGTIMDLFKSVFSLDSITWFLARKVVHEFGQATVNWIRTGQDPFFSGGTEGSLFVTNIDELLLDAADNQASLMLRDYFGPSWDKLCSPFRLRVGLGLSQSYGRGYGSFGQKARCSITDIVDNVEDFYENFENGGWAAWIKTARYENTAWGLLTLAEEESRERETRAVRANQIDASAGLGFLGLRDCVKGVRRDGSVVRNPPNKPDIRCTDYLTKTPGRAVVDSFDQATRAQLDKVGAADEINEIIAALFDKLLSWIVGGGSGSKGLLGTVPPNFKEKLPTSPCGAPSGRPNGCVCSVNTQCRSNQCTNGTCAQPNTGVKKDIFTANISGSNKAWVVHRPYNSSNPLYGPVGEGNATPRWHIIQWNASNELPGETNHLGNTSDNTWSIEESRQGSSTQLRVKGVPQGSDSGFQLLSDTTGSNFIGCAAANELDLLMGPNPEGFIPASYPMGLIPMAERPSLGATGNYRLSFTARVMSGQHINDGVCATDTNVYSGVVGVHLINLRTFKHLQYQIIPYDSRGAGPTGWYDMDGSDGYCGSNDDIMNAYNKPRLIVGGGAVPYDIDVESRLHYYIQNAPSSCWGSDSKDMNDWKPLMYYIGSYINGKARGEIEILSSMLYVQ